MLIRAGTKVFNPRSVTSDQWVVVRCLVGCLLGLAVFLRARAFYMRSSSAIGQDPFAYVFYATDDVYACSALINAIHLRTTLNTAHPIYLLATSSVQQEYIERFTARGFNVIISPAPPIHTMMDYYDGSLLKLMAFGMYNFVPHLRRVIIMDSDQLVLKNLDHLFHLPSISLAAPRAYWLNDEKHIHPLTSALMVIEQSPEIWAVVEEGLRTIAPEVYDMDLVQALFGDSALVLPGHYTTLNSHWEAWDLPNWFTGHGSGPETVPDYERSWESTDVRFQDLWRQVAVLHYTARGKPWSWTGIPLQKNAHWLLERQFEIWNSGLNGKITAPSAFSSNFTELLNLGPKLGAEQVCIGFGPNDRYGSMGLMIDDIPTTENPIDTRYDEIGPTAVQTMKNTQVAVHVVVATAPAVLTVGNEGVVTTASPSTSIQ